MGKVVGKLAVKNSAVSKEVVTDNEQEEFDVDKHIAFLEKNLKRVDKVLFPDVVEQIEFQIAQLKSGS